MGPDVQAPLPELELSHLHHHGCVPAHTYIFHHHFFWLGAGPSGAADEDGSLEDTHTHTEFHSHLF